MKLMFLLLLFSSTKYPLTTTVTEVNYTTDTVVCTDFNGNEWKFYGTDDWLEGDICSMIMDTNGTNEIYDDIIVKVKYDGWVY